MLVSSFVGFFPGFGCRNFFEAAVDGLHGFEKRRRARGEPNGSYFLKPFGQESSGRSI